MDLKERLQCYHPNQEQLLKLNSLKPANHPELTSEELVVVPIAASNNLIHASNSKWSIPTLEKITASYAQGGQDFLLDHAWSDSLSSVGIVFGSELWHYPTPDQEMMEYLLEKSVNDYDRKILKEEGYYQVILYAAIEDSHPIHSQIRFQRSSDVSIGGLANVEYYCPLCSNETEMIKFSDERCPHYMPTRFFLNYCEIPPEEQWRIAPYFIEHGWDNSVEVSLVSVGDCKQARIVSDALLDILC